MCFSSSNDINGTLALTIGGEIAGPFVPWLEAAKKIIGEITKIFRNAQYNQKTCKVLVKRVNAISDVIEKLNKQKEENEKFRDQSYYNAFVRFVRILKEIKEFIQDVSQLKGQRKYAHGSAIKDRCKDLIEEFEDCCSSIQFIIVISQEDREKEDVYLEEDVIAMRKFLESIGQGATIIDEENGIKLDLVFDEVSEMQKKVKKSENDELLTAPQILPTDLTTIGRKVERGKIYKQILRQAVPVACKPVVIPDNSKARKIKGQLAILERLHSSNNIIKFHGVATINGRQHIILDWAEHGNLKEVYSREFLDWTIKLKLAHEICNGLVFLQACDIYHHDIRCENILITGDTIYEAKIANFYLSRDIAQISHGIQNLAGIIRWLAPEKMPKGNSPIKEPYTFKCEIFSFGMLLWELAFQKFPYKSMQMQEITEHVLAGKREELDFSSTDSSEIIMIFRGVIEALIKDLFRIFSESRPDFEEQPEIEYKLLEPDDTENNDLLVQSLSLKPIPSLDEGIAAHKRNEHEKAWECFEIHAQLDDPKAKYWMGYYLWEGFYKQKDPERAKELFKAAADAGVADAQLRYAFAVSKDNFSEFLKYLVKAADSGNPTALFNIADIHIKGRIGIDKNAKKGLQYLRLAALKGQPKAIEALKKYDLSSIQAPINGTPEDYIKYLFGRQSRAKTNHRKYL
ncbi:7207_t:CDS:2 [Diversispora eburnea]|uniref:7207_t:CDS:1 n=1 Tax=Diversispora eburnea TaxID=1213867 RepID=A0A9N8VAT3_9GLOM|nr:7207_t:CDS:2 [Diversispora eburnea]